MPQTSDINKRMTIFALTWPIFIEILLRTAIGTSDVFMLSSYSDKAVSAVGVTTQFTFFLMIVSSFVSSGTGILIAQFNGSGRKSQSMNVGVASIIMSVFIGIFLSIIAVLGAIYLLPFYGLENQVEKHAFDYLLITGLFTFNITIGIVFATILRSYGYARAPMFINIFSGVLNVIGNYIALYQPFGLPVYGVEGVAIATVVTQLISTLLLAFILFRSNIKLPLLKFTSIPKDIYKKIISIGGMNAGEVLAYNLAQMAIIYFVVQMGTASLAAFTYAQNISRLAFAFALSIGQASQIQTGYYVGKGWVDEILKKVQIYYVVGFISSVTVTGLIYLYREPILHLFTDQADVIKLASLLLAGSILLESGRVFNLIFISALKGAGDVKFPVQMGVICMWGLGVLFSYIFGIHLGFGVIGTWLAIALDEWVRGVIMVRRWRSKVWTRFKFS